MADDEEGADRLHQNLHTIFESAILGTDWHFDGVNVYKLGWGQCVMSGRPQYGERVAQNCRSGLNQEEMLTDVWISLHDDTDEAPMNVQEIVDTFANKQLSWWPMLDPHFLLNLRRGGRVF